MPVGRTVSFQVVGTPVPQGSTRAFVVNGRAVTTSKTRNLVEWRRAIADGARQANGFADPLEGPLSVTVYFTLRRPKSAPRREVWPAKRPDLDKLVRAVLDGLSVDAQVIRDDAQVVGAHGPLCLSPLPLAPLSLPAVEETVEKSGC